MRTMILGLATAMLAASAAWAADPPSDFTRKAQAAARAAGAFEDRRDIDFSGLGRPGPPFAIVTP